LLVGKQSQSQFTIYAKWAVCGSGKRAPAGLRAGDDASEKIALLKQARQQILGVTLESVEHHLEHLVVPQVDKRVIEEQALAPAHHKRQPKRHIGAQ
jgi:hypothetical protein